MTRVRGLVLGLGVIFSVILLLGCESTENEVDRSLGSQVSSSVASAAISRIPSEGGMSEPQHQMFSDGSQGGISVSGSGSISVEPDLAILNIGVEATGKTVSFARSEAASAMDSVVSSLKKEGILTKDIQTQQLTIYPRYDYQTNKQVLTGYSVTNTARVKVRDLSKVGKIVDNAAASGGDYVRINGISFNVEDTDQYMESLRKQAVQKAQIKAEEYADSAGVKLGSLRSLTEVGAQSPHMPSAMDNQMRAMSVPMESPISGGELQITVTVFTVFNIY
ncbi:MAG: SIMPL domain-containing protein [Chloroflexota bacterium]|nr:SIMPL domain-containing protein [Chloroflexota bacterium]